MSNYRTLDVARLSEMFGALSNPNRLALLLRLFERCGSEGSCSTDQGMGACVNELADGLDLAKSTVSHHLKELRRTGLIAMERQGRTVRCTVNTAALDELSSLLDQSRSPKTRAADITGQSRGVRPRARSTRP